METRLVVRQGMKVGLKISEVRQKWMRRRNFGNVNLKVGERM
jgi:hypothetical protein